jgi:hypothetical protein
MLVKPTHTRILLQQIEKLLASHEEDLSIWSVPAPRSAASSEAKESSKPAAANKPAKILKMASTAKGPKKVAAKLTTKTAKQ